MIHPSYVELMNIVNKDVKEGETPVINSRYSIVMATAKRARQLIDGDEPLVDDAEGKKPLSIAVEELQKEKIKILPQDEDTIEAEEDAEVAKARALEGEFEEEEIENSIEEEKKEEAAEEKNEDSSAEKD
ncbi:MAG: DNA-directed RNA polymerase subunit omega [Lachnospiraceae bacterium]|jgi:DNA-directed RNA polymerase subunit omega|nr:DNA-directed RNA polymerase subunit omega [Lachnospiraceae bacterium]